MSQQHPNTVTMANRFRGFLPVVVDLETAGFNADKDALLEIAIVTLLMDDNGLLQPHENLHYHIKPFEGANLDPKSLEFTGIEPYHPFRLAVDEDDALTDIFQCIDSAINEQSCQRAVMVAHNAMFDQNFLIATAKRCKKLKDYPFHQFTTFDTAALSGLAYGQTVLARAVKAAGLEFDASQAHSAKYDAQVTAELFCNIVNKWKTLGGI